jgi:hypothetical protein
LDAFSGDRIAIVIADGVDRMEDVVRGYRTLSKSFDCGFG